MALARSVAGYFDPDPEPFQAGEEEDLEEIETEVWIHIYYCLDCDEVVNAWCDAGGLDKVAALTPHGEQEGA